MDVALFACGYKDVPSVEQKIFVTFDLDLSKVKYITQAHDLENS